MAERFSDELRTARLARGLELKDVARATRISIRVLEAIESGNLQILPGAYVRAFLRDYASYLGLNPTTILAGYDASKPAPPQPVATPAPSAPPRIRMPERGADHDRDRERMERAERAQRERAEREARRTAERITEPPRETTPPVESRVPARETSANAGDEPPQRIQPMKAPRVKRVDTNLTAIIAGAIVVLTGFVLIYFFVAGDGNDKKLKTVTTQAPPPPIVPQYTPPAAAEQKPADTIPPAQPNSPQNALPANATDALTLEATTSDSVWMSVVGDTAHLQRGVMQKGQHVTWHAKTKFLVTVGNSSLVVLTLNGKKLVPGDATSRVLRNCVVTAGTTALVPGDAPAVTQKKSAPPTKNAPAKAPLKTAPGKPSPATHPAPGHNAAGVKNATPQKVGNGTKTATPVKNTPAPKKKLEAKKKIKLKPFPDTIEKVQIK